MGYETYMQINIEENGPDPDAVSEKLAEITGDDTSLWQEIIEGGENVKWYEHTNDMRRLSAAFPDALFTLSGDGEDTNDQWVEYHKNGLTQTERMPDWTPDPFDPVRLK